MKRWVESSVVENSPASSFVKINAFQKIMRLWDQVHPYNAVQAFRMEGDPDIEKIQSAWRTTLKSMGLGRVIVRRDEFCHTILDDTDDRGNLLLPPPGTTLDQHLSAEMNVAIDPDNGCPFRAFLLRDGSSHIAGVTYHHWVADSFSIRRLLHEWFLQVRDPNHVTKRPAIPSGGLWHYFGPNPSHWRVDDAILGMLRYRTRFSCARRIDRPMDDCTLAVSLHHLPDGIVPGLTSAAKKHGVTLNDLLLSAIAQTVDQFGACPATPGRGELTLGTVVDLRAMEKRRMNDLFGLFLGITTTMVRPADLNDWPRLLRTVARQNAFHKQSKTPQSSVIRMAAGIIEAKIHGPRRWASLYRDRMPVAAGISNVNMNRNWAGQHHPSPVLDYFRVAPTGPLLPVIFTPTTLGKKLNFLMTRQRSLIDDVRAGRIVESLTNRLNQLAE